MELRERHRQLSALSQYAREAREGRGRLVLVSGDAGVGKSALVETFAEELDDARVLWGASDGQFTPRPLGPVLDIAAQAGGELARLAADGTPREALFTAARAELTGDVCAGGPLTVAVFEDVHWADEATLDLLRFLGRRLRDARSLLVVTYRDQGTPTNDSLRIALGDLSSQRGTRRIAVPPLTRSAVDALAAGSAVSGEELYRLTGGNPFFVGEVLRGAPGQIPPSAIDSVLARLAQLPPAARRYAEAAALMGARIDPALLVEVVGEETTALDALVGSGLLVSDGHRLRFQHELARAAVEQETQAHRRTPMHRRILTALVGAGETDDARMAYHAEGAEDSGAVLEYAPAAARQAARLRSHREAALQYERALRFADATPDSMRAGLHDALSGELSLVDRWEDAADHAERALALWQTTDDPASRSGTERFLSRVMWRLNRGADALRLAEQARRTVEPLGDTAALARADANLSLALSNEARYAESLVLAHKAQQLGEDSGLPDVLSDALDTEACVLAIRAEDRWRDVMLRSIQVAKDHQLQAQAGRAYANMHAALTMEHRYAEATHCFREGLAYCEDHDLATFSTCLRSSQAVVELETGRWDRAEASSRQLLAMVHISPANAITPQLNVGRILGRRGDADALTFLNGCVGSAVASGEPEWLAATLPGRAETHWLLGDHESALRDLRSAAQIVGVLDPWRRGLVASWLHRLGTEVTVDPEALPEPHRLSVLGEHEAAARAWDRLSSPFDAALVRYDAGTETSLREALASFEDLGAEAAARLCRRELRRLGVRSVPVGARASTREHPAGLTRRESEVLDLLVEGLRNEEIAARLVISVKTVDHHVSAVLGKLGVSSRGAAVTEARRLGLGVLAT